VEILCTRVWNGKTGPIKTIPGMGGGGINENDEGSEFNYEHYKNFCKYHNVPLVQH
jgi:hypothetical protein